MKLILHCNSTTIDATMDMIGEIDYHDFSQEHIVVVPDRFSLQMEKLLLESLHNSAFFNVKVQGLTGLASEILSRLGRSVEVLSSADCLLYVQQAIENVKSEFVIFKKSNISFCHEIYKILQQLKSSKVGCDDLNEKASGMSGGKYHDIMLIYKEYQRLIAGKFDANERLALLRELLDGEGCDVLKNVHFYFGQFDSFTEEGYDLLKSILRASAEVNISTARAANIGNEYVYEKDIFDKVIAIAKEFDLAVEIKDSHRQLPANRQAVVNGLYSLSEQKACNNGFYFSYSANSVNEEVTSAAKAIYAYIHRGFKYSDICLCTSDIGRYQPIIDDIFDRFDIPHYCDSSVTAEKSLLSRTVFDFFEVVSSGFGSIALQKLFSNQLVGCGQLCALVQSYSIDNRWKYKKLLSESFDFDNILQEIEGAKVTSQFIEITRKICQTFLQAHQQTMEMLAGRGDLKEQAIEAQIPEILSDTLDTIARHSGNEISLSEFVKKLKLLLSYREVSTVPTYLDGVMVGDATASLLGRCKVLIVLGCQSLPQVSGDNALLSDHDISLNFVDKKIQPTIRMINRRNRFKLFNLLSLPTDKLILFYNAVNDEGKKNDQPVFVHSCNSLFDAQTLPAYDVFFDLTGKRDVSGLTLAAGNRQSLQTERQLSKSCRERLGIADTEQTANLCKDHIERGQELFFGKTIGVTQIENYFSCPFKHFASYGLHLKEKEVFEFDARDVGNICHKGAELFGKAISDGGIEDVDVKKFVSDNIDKIIADTGATDKLENNAHKTSIKKYFMHQLEVLCSGILREQKASDFRPVAFEYRLPTAQLAPGVRISGRVDRIDRYNDFFRIIDYKTGRTGNLLKELYFGKKLQLFIYQKIAGKALGLKPAGVLYFDARHDFSSNDEDSALLKGIVSGDSELLHAFDKNLDYGGKSDVLPIAMTNDGRYRGNMIAKDDLSVYEDYAAAVAASAVEECKSGFIQPKPDSESCNFCKYKPLCGFEATKGKRMQGKIGEYKIEKQSN